MKDASPRKPGLPVKRIAATTAAIFGTALLAVPNVANAADADCTASSFCENGSVANAATAADPEHSQTAFAATGITFDYDQDFYADLVTVRRSDGALVLQAGTGSGPYEAAVVIGSGWGGYDIVMADDLTGDGLPDLLARDTKTGTLYTYQGNGKGGHGSRIKVGTGWNGMGVLTSAGDYDENGTIDLLAVRKSDGNLYFYPGRGDGTFGSRVSLGAGWNAMDTVTTVGDFNQDGYDDFLAHSGRNGVYYLYPGKANGYFGSRIDISSRLNRSDLGEVYTEVTGAGDGNVVALHTRSGELTLHAFSSTGSVRETETVGAEWGGFRLPTGSSDRTYDYNGDGANDLIAQRDDITYVYPGTGTGALGPRVSQGVVKWEEFLNLITTAGDLNNDGFADIIIRDKDGSLARYGGDGTGIEGTGMIIGNSGWNAMGTVVAGHDHNSDGRDDLIAADTSGNLWLYPGASDSDLGARVKIGTGWNSMREVTLPGDLDHDGHADLIAVKKSDGCLYFYGGKGNGFFKSRVQIGCGWGGYDAITAMGDFNRDGHGDWLARRKSDGNLFLYKGDGAGSYTSRTQIGTAWNSMMIA